MGQTFDFTLSQSDIARTLEFKARLIEDHKEYFNSDDFRYYNLARFYDDPAHEIGGLFAKLKANGFIKTVGELPSEIASNNKRKIDLFCWNGNHFESWLSSRLH